MTAAVSTASGINDLRARIAALQARFAEIGAFSARTAADVAAGGAPPSEELLAQLTATSGEFHRLRDDVLESAGGLELVLPKPSDALVTLRDLVPVVDALAGAFAAAERRRRHEAARTAALYVIDRVEAIVHDDDPTFAPLAECHRTARALREHIAGATASDTDVMAWAERLRPYADLLEMLEAESTVDDERFAALADSVGAAFGRALATAALRGRLLLP